MSLVVTASMEQLEISNDTITPVAGDADVVNTRPYVFTNVTFQVEGERFTVPRYYFEEESSVFRDMFRLPVAPGATPDGATDEQPLQLSGVNRDDFRQLLRVMFPTRILVPENLSVRQWTSVLNLAVFWDMNDLSRNIVNNLFQMNLNASDSLEDWMVLLDICIRHHIPEARTLAMLRLSSMVSSAGGSEKVVLARRYRMSTWLNDGLRTLVERTEFFSDAEQKHLGWETIFKLCRLREKYRTSSNRPGKLYKRPAWTCNIEQAMKQEFRDEFEDMGESVEAMNILHNEMEENALVATPPIDVW